MLWVILVTIHLISIVVYTLLLRTSSVAKIDKILMAALMQTGIHVPAYFYLFSGQVNFHHSALNWSLLGLGGFMLAGLIYLNVASLAILDASIFTIIFNVRMFVVTVLAYIFLGTLPTRMEMAGGIIILVSILMLNLHKDKQWKSASILVAVFTMVWFSVHSILEKRNLNHIDVPTYIYIFGLIATILLWAMVFVRRVDVSSQLHNIKDKKVLALVVSRGASGYSYIYAVARGPVAVTNYVGGMSVALIVLFGIFVMGEKDKIPHKMAAVGTSLVGLTLILISRLS